jgi:hypothetical protein
VIVETTTSGPSPSTATSPKSPWPNSPTPDKLNLPPNRRRPHPHRLNHRTQTPSSRRQASNYTTTRDANPGAIGALKCEHLSPACGTRAIARVPKCRGAGTAPVTLTMRREKGSACKPSAARNRGLGDPTRLSRTGHAAPRAGWVGDTSLLRKCQRRSVPPTPSKHASPDARPQTRRAGRRLTERHPAVRVRSATRRPGYQVGVVCSCTAWVSSVRRGRESRGGLLKPGPSL